MQNSNENLPTHLRTVTGRVRGRRRYSMHTIIELDTQAGHMELYATRGGVEGVVVEEETWSFELDDQGRVAAGRVL